MRKGFVLFLAYFCIACLLASLIIFINPAPFVKLYILGIEKTLNLDISFSLDSNRLFDKWRFKDVKIISSEGYGINIETLTLEPSFPQLLKDKYKFKFKCSAQNIKLHGKLPLPEGTVSLLLKEPPEDKIFETVETTMVLGAKSVKMLNLKAIGKGARLRIKSKLININM